MALIATNSRDMTDFKPKKDFFVGIDSDGCVFDAMEIKHKECFIPNTVNAWRLQTVSRYAREVHEFVNLYSKWRGLNRWPNIIRTMDLLRDHPGVRRCGFEVMQLEGLRSFVESGTKLSDAGLYAYMRTHHEPDLYIGVQWSSDVNAAIERIVHGMMPFTPVKPSFEAMAPYADLACVSATRNVDLAREWTYAGIMDDVELLCGQEVGNKEQILRMTAEGKYPKDHVLMMGDAPGDMQAAHATGALFYPINPGYEADSWDRFYSEGYKKFLDGTYAGEYEAKLIREFESLLPEVPPWEK
jgi:phosphoglycolate phosphatase-like HAD superfamily hydrolase